MVSDRSEQQATALVERLDGKGAAARRQHQRRVDKAHIPARIAAGKLEARRTQDAATVVEPVGQPRIGRAVGLHDDLALDADAALGLIAGALHENPLRVPVASEVRWSRRPEMRRPPGAPRRPMQKRESLAARVRRATTNWLNATQCSWPDFSGWAASPQR